MKIIVTSWGDGYESSGIETDVETLQGNRGVEFSDGEPEDMVIARDLGSAKDIWRLIELAYYAGKNGEELEISHVKRDE